MKLTIAAVVALCAMSVTLAAQQIASEQNRREALQLFRTGQQAFSQNEFPRAIDTFLQAIEKDPLLVIARYQLGQSYMAAKDYPNAIMAFTGCIDAERTLFGIEQKDKFQAERVRDDQIQELQAVLKRGGRTPTMMALEQQMHDLENSRTLHTGEFQPSSEVLLSLGSAYFRNGDRDGAETQWKAAVAANPKLGEAHNNLAVIDMQKGAFDEAERELSLAEKAGFKVNPQFKADLKARKNGEK